LVLASQARTFAKKNPKQFPMPVNLKEAPKIPKDTLILLSSRSRKLKIKNKFRKMKPPFFKKSMILTSINGKTFSTQLSHGKLFWKKP
jgi:hypothetical protein